MVIACKGHACVNMGMRARLAIQQIPAVVAVEAAIVLLVSAFAPKASLVLNVKTVSVPTIVGAMGFVRPDRAHANQGGVGNSVNSSLWQHHY